jgi:1,2-diacylglycerol 3-beta-glucosyltransferase
LAEILLTAYLLAALPGAAFGVYLLVLSVAALFYRPAPGPGGEPANRLLVLIPAHNESALVARCVRSLLRQTYPQDLYEVMVIADNCTDDTAAIAARAGAKVLRRTEPDARGKGQALRWAMDRVLDTEPVADAVVVVDADSVADRDFLTILARPLTAGALAVQGEHLLEDVDAPGTALRVAAVLLVNRVRPAGRAALGLPVAGLAGNGMLLTRGLLLARPWNAFTSAEDLEYSIDLHKAGVNVTFARGAVLHSPPAANAHAAAQQQLRWEGGKAYLARTQLPSLVGAAIRQRRPMLLNFAFELAMPPLGFLTAAILGGGTIGVGLVLLAQLPAWVLLPWALALLLIVSSVLIGLKAGQAPRSNYLALTRAPLFVVTKPLRARQVLSFRGDTWIRTERAAASEVQSGEP